MPYYEWTFDGSVEDESGLLGGILLNGAYISDGQLFIPEGASFRTNAPISPFNTSRTVELYLTLLSTVIFSLTNYIDLFLEFAPHYFWFPRRPHGC